MWKEVDQRIRRAMNGVRQAFRGVGSSTTNSGPAQTMQGEGLAGEPIQGNEFFQHFGFTSRPPAGYQFIALPVGGQTSHAIIIATEHGDYRLKTLKPGEVALYDAFGTSVVLKEGRVAEVNCAKFVVNASVSAEFNTPVLTASAQVVAQGVINGNGGMAIQGGNGASFSGNVSQTGGNITTDGDVVASGTSLHGHHHNGDSGGTTSAPV